MNTVLLQAQLRYGDMGRAERLAADFLLSHAEEVPTSTISEIADRSGSSEATLVRLSRRLGYAGFQEMKVALAKGAGTVSATPNIAEDDTCGVIFEKVCNDAYLSLERTKKLLSPDALEAAAEALAAAGKIVFVGLGSSSAVAEDAAGKLLRAGCDAAAYSDTHMQTVVASYLGPGDVMVGVSQSGTSRDIVEVMKLAHSRGVTTICITGREKAPIMRHSDVVLLTDTEEVRHTVLALSSHLARLAVTDALCFRVACRNAERIRATQAAEESSLRSKRVDAEGN